MSYFTPYKEHYKALIRLGIPIVIGQIGIVVVGLADNMMVGQYATLDLAAASFVNSAFNIPILFGLGFSYGLTPLVGQFFGRHDKYHVGHFWYWRRCIDGAYSLHFIPTISSTNDCRDIIDDCHGIILY